MDIAGMRAALLVLLVLGGSACQKLTEAEVERWINEETPVGSTKEHVISALDERDVEHSGRYKPKLYYEKNRTISAAFRGSSWGILVTGDIIVEYKFNSKDQLEAYSVKEILTGL
jgi:hypothetical protein